MAFQWDAGNIDHIARHGITSDEAEQVVENNPLTLGQEKRNGEHRILHLGETKAGRVLFVTITMRGEDIRVVTAYPAKKKLRTTYFELKVLNDEKHSQDS